MTLDAYPHHRFYCAKNAFHPYFLMFEAPARAKSLDKIRYRTTMVHEIETIVYT